MAKINVSELTSTIMEELEKYSDEIAENVKKEAKKVSKNCKNELKNTSPKDTGEYAEGWATKTLFENKETIRIAVHNKKYQLTHLLEKGHAKVTGGRVEGIPHIAPAEEKAKTEFLKSVEAVIKGK